MLDKILAIKVLLFSGPCSAVGLFLFKSQNNKTDRLVFANYNGYMSTDLMGKAKGEFDMQFESLDSDKQVADNFKNNIYHAAVVSNSTHEELMRAGLLKGIDWTKLDLKKCPPGCTPPTGGPCDPATSEKVTNHTEATCLYSGHTQKILKKNPKQIEYGIPYFLSYLSFFYRGEEIPELKGLKSWSELIQAIVAEPRFQNGTGLDRKISMIDDARTIYSLTELLHADGEIKKTSLVSSDTTAVVPEVPPVEKIASMSKWSELGFNRKNMGTIFITPDSNDLVNMLSKKEVTGSFLYGGDAMFSIQGGDAEEVPDENDFYTVTPDKSIYFLDSLVISKNIPEKQEASLYEFIKKMFFEGIDQANMFETDDEYEEEGYKYWPALNFDQIYYTPTLKKMTDELEADSEIYAPEEDGVGDPYKDIKQQMLMIETNPPADPKIFYEGYMGHKHTTNMYMEYETWKSNF